MNQKQLRSTDVKHTLKWPMIEYQVIISYDYDNCYLACKVKFC